MASHRLLLITGGNTGLGHEVVKALAASSIPYTIMVGSRSTEKAAKSIEEVKKLHPSTASNFEPISVDIESDESIAAAAAHVTKTHGRLDILINNAGAAFDSAAAEGKLTTREAWNKSWDVNVTGTHIMTEAFVPLLLKGSDARLLFVASGTSSLTRTMNPEDRLNKPLPAGWPKANAGISSFISYRSTKTGLNMMVRQWDRMLRNDGVRVWGVSPGFLATNLGGTTPEELKKLGAMDPAIGGAFMRDVIEGKRDADSGMIINKDGVQPW